MRRDVFAQGSLRDDGMLSRVMSECAARSWIVCVRVIVVQEPLPLVLLTMDNVSVVWYVSHDVCLNTGLLKDRRPEPQASACAGRNGV